MAEFHCENCGAVLSAPNQPCPYCTEAQRLLRQLVEQDEVRLCARCGELLEDSADDLCPACRKAVVHRGPWRRDDRIAGWIRDRFVEPVGEREGIVCPSCGAPAPALAAFCSSCGRRLAGTPEVGVPPESPAGAAPGPSGGPAGGMLTPTAAPPTEPPASAPAAESRPGWWQQALEFGRDMFRPRGPVPDQPAAPWYQQVGRWMRAQFAPEAGEENRDYWLWIVLGLLLVGIAALAVFWATLLRSGDVIFR